MPPGDARKLPGIFISYRRSDTPDAVGRIYDRLIAEFGKARVFKDVDSIPLGQDFRGHLNDIVGNCVAVLAIIGPKWTDIRSETGQRRLDDPDDFVRIELEAALARKVPVVPVLVGHAAMPATSQLPASLSSLAFRQAVDVRPDPDFHGDATRLVTALRAIIDPNAPPVELHSGKPKSRGLPWLAALAATATLAAVALAVPAFRHFRQAPPVETRTDIVTPNTERPGDFALSPDGRQIAFVASGDGESRLWLRSLASTSAQPLAETEGATSPFWSPDSRAVAFFARGRLKRLNLADNAVQSVTAVPNGNGGSWGTDGTILYSIGPGTSPLQRVPATGGTAVAVTEVMASQAGSHRWPQWLPDGRFLFSAGTVGNSGIYLGTLDSLVAQRLTEADSAGLYLPTGWLLWVREGALIAQRLDLEQGRLTGETVTVASGVGVNSVSSGIPVSVDATGQIAYRTGEVASQTLLTWMDRSGETKGTIGASDMKPSNPRVSPDGRRVAVDRVAQKDADIWLVGASRLERLTFAASEDERPLWSPDGAQIFYRARSADGSHLYRQSASGSGEPELLLSSERTLVPTSVSADGRFVLYFEAIGLAITDSDLMLLPLTGDRKPFPLFTAAGGQVWGSLSPDGKWVVYQSNESGDPEVYVRRFAPPGSGAGGAPPKGGQWQVSSAGGAAPVWRSDSKEIYFLDPGGAMMAAAFSVQGETPVISPEVKLFQTKILGGGGFGVDAALGRQYDVATDGRFLINAIVDMSVVPPITLLQNWNPARQD